MGPTSKEREEKGRGGERGGRVQQKCSIILGSVVRVSVCSRAVRQFTAGSRARRWVSLASLLLSFDRWRAHRA